MGGGQQVCFPVEAAGKKYAGTRVGERSASRAEVQHSVWEEQCKQGGSGAQGAPLSPLDAGGLAALRIPQLWVFTCMDPSAWNVSPPHNFHIPNSYPSLKGLDQGPLLPWAVTPSAELWYSFLDFCSLLFHLPSCIYHFLPWTRVIYVTKLLD